jgi:flavin-binding protein dodecin
MSTVKVIEVLAESEKGWEDAAKVAIHHAGGSVRDIRSIYIKEMEATVSNGEIASYRINAKVSFGIEGT